MFLLKFYLWGILILFYVCFCQRRIKEGQIVTSAKSYVVYLIKASTSSPKYDAWLCGGALVSTEHIITSAACVEDVHYMYAIAGYNTYVPDQYVEYDDCIKAKRKKVVFKSVPVAYNFSYQHIEKWSHIDISIIRVESPYDLNDASYNIFCSYRPTIIEINYDLKHQRTDTDTIVLGWGHNRTWRTVRDRTNLNMKDMHYAAMKIYDKEKCKESYQSYPEMVHTIDAYMICTLERGYLNDVGEPAKVMYKAEGCGSGTPNVYGLRSDDCKENRTTNNMYSQDSPIIDRPYEDDETRRQSFSGETRKNGICQNDHGGPLVTWVGAREVLIGVASVFRVNDVNECIGPFLFTSTHCNGHFINCMIHADFKKNNEHFKNHGVKLPLCNLPPAVRGFDIINTRVSWKDHPDGPADNERHSTRNRHEKKKKNSFLEKLGQAGTVTEKIENPLFPSNDKSYDSLTPKDRFTDQLSFPAKRQRDVDRLTDKLQKPTKMKHDPASRFTGDLAMPPKRQRPPADRVSFQPAVPSNMRHPPNERYSQNAPFSVNMHQPTRDRFPQQAAFPPNINHPPGARSPPQSQNMYHPPGDILPPQPPNMRFSPNNGYQLKQFQHSLRIKGNDMTDAMNEPAMRPQHPMYN